MRIPELAAIRTVLWLLAGLWLAPNSWPDSAALSPVADTTLIEGAPTNNLGGQNFFLSGSNASGSRNRALLRFDLAGQVPPGSKITEASLVLEVTQTPGGGGASSVFALHRVLQAWGEGNKTSGVAPRFGAPATTNEATWNDRFAFATNAWSAPGGAPPADFSPLVSAEQQVYGIADSPYNFASTPTLVADVRAWLDDPGTNFGWILISQDEARFQTGRRFGSREDPANSPRLVVAFQPPRIDRIDLEGDRCLLTFMAQAGRAYAVQSRDSLAALGDWGTLTNIPAPAIETNLVISDALLPGQRFFRLLLP